LVDNVSQAIAWVEILVAVELSLGSHAAHGQETGIHVIRAAQTPNGHGNLADQRFLGGGGGLVLGLDVIQQILEVVGAFTLENQGGGGKSVFNAVEPDGGASFGRLRACAFLGVASVRFELAVGYHEVAPDFGFPGGGF
jgi:hypothetical protein